MFGSIVLSLAGRDKGGLYIVTELKENFALIVDGKVHKVENPKLKKLKHLEAKGLMDDSIAEKIKNGSKITNQEIKRVLKKFGGSNV